MININGIIILEVEVFLTISNIVYYYISSSILVVFNIHTSSSSTINISQIFSFY